MTDQFMLPVTYNGVEQEYVVHLIRSPYTYQLEVHVDDQKLFFEPDEEDNYRLVRMPWQAKPDASKIDTALISQIMMRLKEVSL